VPQTQNKHCKGRVAEPRVCSGRPISGQRSAIPKDIRYSTQFSVQNGLFDKSNGSGGRVSGIIFWNVSGQDAKCGPITLAPNEIRGPAKGEKIVLRSCCFSPPRPSKYSQTRNSGQHQLNEAVRHEGRGRPEETIKQSVAALSRGVVCLSSLSAAMRCPLEPDNLLIRSCHDVPAVPGSATYFWKLWMLPYCIHLLKTHTAHPTMHSNLSGRPTTQ
jgi:hypothetical protein